MGAPRWLPGHRGTAVGGVSREYAQQAAHIGIPQLPFDPCLVSGMQQQCLVGVVTVRITDTWSDCRLRAFPSYLRLRNADTAGQSLKRDSRSHMH
jgi:hypothetical protein